MNKAKSPNIKVMGLFCFGNTNYDRCVAMEQRCHIETYETQKEEEA